MSADTQKQIWLSPTQIDTYRLCKRKWAWGYIAGIKSPPNRFAQLGLDVHDVLEAFLVRGTAPDRATRAGAIAIPGLKYLPAPGAAVVEGKFSWELPGEPFGLTGRIDWREPSDPAFGDHKTSGDFKWAKTPEILAEDVQAVIYAAYILHLTGAASARGRWVYYRTKRTPKAMSVDFEMGRAHVDGQMVGILETGREMVGWKQQTKDAKDLPTDARGCGAFGGCYYRDRCNLTAKERMMSLMAQESIKEKLARKKAEAQAKPEPAVNPPENATASEPPQPPEQQGLSLQEKLTARKAGAKPEQASAQAEAAPPAKEPTLKEKMAARKGGQPTAGAPPPAPAPQSQRGQKTAARNPHAFEVLFVDCGPVKSPAYKLIPLAEILEHSQDGPLAQVVDDSVWGEGACVSMSLKTPIGQEVYEVLSSRAALVVRGF